MKKVLIIIISGALLIACGGNKSEQQEDTPAKLSTSQVAAIGKLLVDESDCKTCHHPTAKIVGPWHTEVAEKYEFTDANIKLLADRIILGGSGVWGKFQWPHMPIYLLKMQRKWPSMCFRSMEKKRNSQYDS